MPDQYVLLLLGLLLVLAFEKYRRMMDRIERLERMVLDPGFQQQQQRQKHSANGQSNPFGENNTSDDEEEKQENFFGGRLKSQSLLILNKNLIKFSNI